MSEHSLLEAINLALHRAMREDPDVLVLGQDVGVEGGVFRATDGLLSTFGSNRVFDTPLAEAGSTGFCVGLAAQGFKPVLEIQFMGFVYSAIDQLCNHASRLRTRTRGRLTCPLVLRAPFGGGIGAPEHHSESAEAMFAHIPGLRVLIPSTPQRAYGLLLAAIADPDPVVFFEPKRLYRSSTAVVDDNGQHCELDQCELIHSGDDLTLVTWGAMVQETLEAARVLEQEGIEAEVIDVVSLKPLDTQTILQSVARTGRLVIVHEAPQTCGYGAEISAQVAAAGLFNLRAPIMRVTGADTVMPLPQLEKWYMPTTRHIVEAARSTLIYA